VKLKRPVLWMILGVVLLAFAALAVWASNYTSKTPRASDAWSRGQIIGQTPIKRRVALQSALDGGVFLVWPNLDEQLELARVGVDGEVLLSRGLPLDTQKPRDPQLRVGRDGRLHLLWREEGEPSPGVRYVVLEADGTPAGQPQAISGPASRVLDAPRLVRTGDCLHALWTEEAGVYWVVLGQGGSAPERSTFLVPGGTHLVAQMDDGGRLHLVWQEDLGVNTRGIYYAVLDLDEGELSDPEEIAQLVVGGRLRLEELALGLGPDTGYVLWSDYDRGFDRYRFQYAFFPLGIPQQKQVSQWSLKLGDGPLAISPLDGQRTPLKVALTERMLGSRQTIELQIAVIAMGQGDVEEQVVTASTQASMKPVLIADDRSYLHLAWLDTGGFGRYRVVYASTAPEVMGEYNALSLWDAANAVFGNVFRLSTVIVGFVASLGMWAVVPLVGLVVYHLVTSEETLDTVRSRVALGVALAVEVALTFALPPRIGVEATWLALRWVAPALTAGVAALVTARIVRRQESAHLFVAFFLFTATNSLLQLILYLLL
jgi:hypothetical protein